MKLSKSSPQFKLIPALLIIFALTICQGAHAVVPAPDGDYPNFNTAEGQNALFSLTRGAGNAAVGWHSLFSNTDGSFNTALGAGTLLFNVGGQSTAVGVAALLSNTTGFFNTATGVGALSNNTSGASNTAIGVNALTSNTTGEFNIGLGAGAGVSVTTASSVICIGSNGENVSNRCYIGNIWTQPVDPVTMAAVFVDTDGKLGTKSSSQRFKNDVKPMDSVSEAILALKPVMFHYKSDAKNTPCFGLIAEEVADVNRDLVVYDKNGDIYTVHYDAVNAMLLNEFLKEHKKVQKLEAALDAMTARLEKQEAELQKVSALVDAGNAPPQAASRN